MLIAIDFDDTLTEYRPKPIEAPFREDALKYIPLIAEKHTLVLWTARSGKDYDECVRRLDEVGLLRYIRLDGDDLPHGKTGKLSADCYIDDRGVYAIMNWKKIYEILMEV